MDEGVGEDSGDSDGVAREIMGGAGDNGIGRGIMVMTGDVGREMLGADGTI